MGLVGRLFALRGAVQIYENASVLDFHWIGWNAISFGFV